MIGLQESQSFSFWLVASLFSYVKENSFVPPDYALFSRLSSSLALSLVDQAKYSHAMSSFCALARRSHFLKFADPTVTDGQKARLLGSDPFQPSLFDPKILGEVLSEYEGAAATTSHLDVSRAFSKGWLFAGSKRKFDAPSGPNPAPPVATASTSAAAQPETVSPLFDGPSKRGGYRSRGNRRGGRGGHRGKGGSRSGKSGQGFPK